MKKVIKLTVAIASTFIFLALGSNTLTAQAPAKEKTPPASIPADVSKVLVNSCVKCHMEPGNTMALSKLSFNKWDAYDAGKQASKAKAINKELTKGKMPPKGFRKDHPEAIPTEADIKVIKDWADSLKPEKK